RWLLRHDESQLGWAGRGDRARAPHAPADSCASQPPGISDAARLFLHCLAEAVAARRRAMTASNRLPDGLLIAFYGDDFTGSAASTEVTTFAGLPTLLFLDPPDQADLAALEGYRCIGVAASRGRSRRTGRAGSCRACSERSSSQRARHALQGLLDARFLAGSRIHRKSHQHRRRDFLHAS